MADSALLEPRLSIDLDALASNYQTLSRRSGKARAGAAVKANAYGLGASQISKRLLKEGCRDFFVATPFEGQSLRKDLKTNDANIYVLGGYRDALKPVFTEHKLIPILNQLGEARDYLAAPTGKSVLHFDTGMNRLGIGKYDIPALQEIGMNRLDTVLIMSHLSCADEPGNPQNIKQRDAFALLRAMHSEIPASLSNTCGIYLGDDFHFDLTRPGIGLYGSVGGQDLDHGLSPTVWLDAPVLQVRDIHPGDSVGYGQTFVTDQVRRIAIVGAGYADGLPRALSNRGRAFIEGQAAPIIGRISMDLTALDVTDCPAAQINATARFIGPDLDEIAETAHTLAYEILTGLSPRARRDYSGTR